MKPVLIVDEAGSLQVLKTVRGHKKSLKSLVEYAEENGAALENSWCPVCHGEDGEALRFVTDLIKERTASCRYYGVGSGLCHRCTYRPGDHRGMFSGCPGGSLHGVSFLIFFSYPPYGRNHSPAAIR